MNVAKIDVTLPEVQAAVIGAATQIVLTLAPMTEQKDDPFAEALEQAELIPLIVIQILERVEDQQRESPYAIIERVKARRAERRAARRSGAAGPQAPQGPGSPQ